MNYYPDRVYPESPDFPIGHDDVPLGDDLYQVVISYITSLVASLTPFLDYLGNIEIGKTKGIYWDAVERIDIVGAGDEVQILTLKVTTLIVDTINNTSLTITGDLIISNDFIMQGTSDLAITGTVTQDYVDREVWTMTQVAEPGDPANDTAIFWISNGTGYGDAGDFVCKITEGGGTTDFTIADYTAL